MKMSMALLNMVLVLSMLLAGCGPTPTPKVVRETVVVDKEEAELSPTPASLEEGVIPIQDGDLLSWCQGGSMPFGYSDTAVHVIGPFGEAYLEDVLAQEGELDWLLFDGQYGYLNVIRAEVVYRDEFGGSLELMAYFSGPLQDLVSEAGEPLWVFNLEIAWHNSGAEGWMPFANYVVTPQADGGNWLVERFRDGDRESSAAKFQAVEGEGVVSIVLPFAELPPNSVQAAGGAGHHVTSVRFSPGVKAKISNFLDYGRVEARDGALCYVGEFEDDETSHPQQTFELQRLAAWYEEEPELVEQLFSYQLYFEDFTWEDYVEGLTPDQIEELMREMNQEGEEQGAQLRLASPVGYGPAKQSSIKKLIDTIEEHEKTLNKATKCKDAVTKLVAVKNLYEAFIADPQKYSGDPTALGNSLAKALKGTADLLPALDPASTAAKDILKAYADAVEGLVKALVKVRLARQKHKANGFYSELQGKRPSEILRGGLLPGKRGFLVIKKLGGPGDWPGGKELFNYLAKVADLKDTGKSFYDMSQQEIPKAVVNWFNDEPKIASLTLLTGRNPIQMFPSRRRTLLGEFDWLSGDEVDEGHLKQWIWEYFDPLVDFVYGGPLRHVYRMYYGARIPTPTFTPTPTMTATFTPTPPKPTFTPTPTMTPTPSPTPTLTPAPQAEAFVQECRTTLEQGKVLLVRHDETGEGDCAEGIRLLQLAIEQASSALALEAGHAEACLCRGLSRRWLEEDLNGAIQDLECAVAGLEGDNRAEAEAELDALRQKLAAPICVVMGSPIFAEVWAGNVPTNPGTTFPANNTQEVWAQWTLANACREQAIVKWYHGGQLKCQHHTGELEDWWEYYESGWVADEEWIEPGQWCMSVYVGPTLMTEGCFSIE